MDEIREQRLLSHRLAGRRFADAEEVVSWFGGMQAQEYDAARWSIGQRVSEATVADVERLLASGKLLRTHLLRPTWHFVHAHDIRWLLQLTAPRVQALNAYWYRKFELEETILSRSQSVITRALRDGEHLTRKELAAILSLNRIEAAGLRLGYILMNAELDGVICSGALRGKQHTYALMDLRVAELNVRSAEDSLAELTRRFFMSHGPATAKDFQVWASLTSATVRQGVELAKSELDSIRVDSRIYWRGISSHDEKARTSLIHLLQGYDEYIIAYSDSKDVLKPEGARTIPADAVMFTHAIILDGRVIGHWRRKPSASDVVIEVQLRQRLNTVESEALDAAVSRYGAFAGKPATWRRHVQ